MRTLTAADLMTPNVLSVRDDMSLGELAEFLTLHEISGAPVQDDSGTVIGVVSLSDIARAAAEEPTLDRDQSSASYYVRGWEDRLDPADLDHFRIHEASVLVRDIMTPKVFSVTKDAPVADIAEILIDAHLHRLLVTRDGKAVGIVTTTDLLGLLVDRES